MPAALPPLPVEDLDHVLAHTGRHFTAARGARLFITGGTGFFGIWLLESLARANDRLGLDLSAVVLTRDPAAFARKAPHLAARGDLAFHQGELRTFAFPAGSFTHLIHAAADTAMPPAGANAEPVKNAMVDGMRHVLDFAAQAGVEKLLFTSSGAVYGPQPVGLAQLPEDFAGQPDTAYGEGKRLSEELCLKRARQGGYGCSIARAFALVGPHLPLEAHFAVGNFIRDALRGGPIRVDGDGTPLRSYLYASDLAIWLWTLLFTGPSQRVYNVGGNQATSIAELAQAVNLAMGGSVPVWFGKAATAGRPPARYVPETTRAEAEFGLRTWIPLNEALVKTVAWHQAQGAIFGP